jgi:uncharacterized membrane protein
MSKKTFSFGDTIGYGWNVMSSHIGFFIGLGFLYLVVLYSAAIVDGIINVIGVPEPFIMISSISSTIIGQIIAYVLTIGMIKIALSFCDEHKPAISTLFNSFDCFWRYLGTAILYVLIVLGGFILFIVPGIIWSIKFSLSYYYVVDKGLGPIEALKASARATDTVKWELFGFGMLCALITYAGILCLGVGIFAAFPTVMIAQALVYRQLAAQTVEVENEYCLPVEPV